MPNRDCFWLKATKPLMLADGEAEIMLYGEIVGDYGQMYKQEFPEDKSASDFDKAIKEAKKSGATRLLLRINSPGGVVNQSIAMRGTLTNAGFESIHIRIEGMCASAATILATIPNAKVTMTKGSEYMIHNPWIIALGNAKELEREVEHLRSLEKTSCDFYAARTGQEEDTIREWMDAETWFTAEEAVKYGFADEVCEESGKEQAAASVTKDALAVMKGMYRHIPEDRIAVTESVQGAEQAADENISNGPDAVAAEGTTENKNKRREDNNMADPKNMTQEELRAENPELCNALMQSAIQAERQRIQDIDDLTLDGEEYRQMADQAKKDGTSAADFQKMIVAHQRAQRKAFMESRKNETEPAANVKGGAAEDEEGNGEEAEMNAFQEKMKTIFANTHVTNETMM